MKLHILLLAIVLTWTGQAQAQPDSWSRYDLSISQRTDVQMVIKYSLKDPGSAVFGPISAARKNDGIVVVCGWINAKNSFGGYTGNRPFIGALIKEFPNFYLGGIGENNKDAVKIVKACEKIGL